MTQTITPYLLYEDAAAALEFLSRAFGFEETLRSTSSEGRVQHAEMRLDDGAIFLGEPGGDYRNPKRLGASTFCLYVYVADADAHCAQARAAGAEIADEPADQEYGDRRYHALDPEGHEWYFAQRIRDVAPGEWGAETKGAAG
jgi:uncharacterized glyoxalase superfamily protein PhnB